MKRSLSRVTWQAGKKNRALSGPAAIASTDRLGRNEPQPARDLAERGAVLKREGYPQ
jgi:hypothetical protein